MQPEPTDDRLRTMEPWLAASLCIGLVLLAVPLMILPGVVADTLRQFHPVPDPFDAAAIGIALSLCTFLAAGPLLGVPLPDVFVRPPGRTTPAWGLFGVLLVGSIAGVTAILVGDGIAVRRDGVGTVARTLLAAAAVATWASVLEEFLVRGYLLGILGRRWNWPGAIAATSALFALLHHGHATDVPSLVAYLGTTGVAGVLFALVTVYTRNVWNAVVIHAAWNTLFAARVLAFRAPGDPPSDAIVTIRIAVQSPPFGGGAVDIPESPLSIAVLLVGVAVVFAWKGRRSP